MQQPEFWQNPKSAPGLLSRLLTPLSAVSGFLGKQRLRQGKYERLPVPVICVGNINIGGTGKTPTVIALVEYLKKRGLNPHVVSRGYGGSLRGPVRVNERVHKASQVGDEPILISSFCPVWVARDRAAGGFAAANAGADVIILDDGFQNPAVEKDISIIVVDAVSGFGNGRVFPAGPLREPIGLGLGRADALVVIGPEKAQQQFAADWSPIPNLPVIGGQLKPLEMGMDWNGHKVFAFAGIGRPEKFFATLRGLGADILHTEALSDHQPLTRRLLERLEADAFFKGAQLVTTEKDAVRLPEDFRFKVLTLAVRLELADWTPIERLLQNAGINRRAL
ncbi:MAG: tetraacyldisaccharide 4'-kinase [Rhodobacterales bacterium]